MQSTIIDRSAALDLVTVAHLEGYDQHVAAHIGIHVYADAIEVIYHYAVIAVLVDAYVVRSILIEGKAVLIYLVAASHTRSRIIARLNVDFATHGQQRQPDEK